MKKRIVFLLTAIVMLMAILMPTHIISAQTDGAKDVIILIDNSHSMTYDCTHPYHSYYYQLNGGTITSNVKCPARQAAT
ncbi:MAG: hypothetical protein ACLVKR_01620 [Lachnospiraceae bacterium]